jgi:hypothetical protein
LRFSRDPGRPLTPGERALADGLFGAALDPRPVRLHPAKWWVFQPRNVVMAPDGGIWFHPHGGLWRDDFAAASPRMRALFAHELTHVWQHQRGLFLPLRRHPFCRYRYRLVPDRPLVRYGIEQQATIVEDAFVGRECGAPHAALERLLIDAGLNGQAV